MLCNSHKCNNVGSVIVRLTSMFFLCSECCGVIWHVFEKTKKSRMAYIHLSIQTVEEMSLFILWWNCKTKICCFPASSFFIFILFLFWTCTELQRIARVRKDFKSLSHTSSCLLLVMINSRQSRRTLTKHLRWRSTRSTAAAMCSLCKL